MGATNPGWSVRLLAIREQVSMEEVIDLLGVEVLGGGQLSCPNPDHQDRHPSARFYVDTGKVHCFTCGQTWDMVGLVQVARRLTFPEAVAWLEQEFMVQAASADMVKATLRRRGAMDCSGLMALVDAAILASRPHCSLPQYARLWRAYDVACHEFAARKIDEAALVAGLDRIMALLPPGPSTGTA